MVIFIGSKILVFVWELCGYILDLLDCKGQVFRRKVKTWKDCKASSLFNDILVTKWRCTNQEKIKKKFKWRYTIEFFFMDCYILNPVTINIS